nr:hypothetical protein [Tanacetum cinerariifolium]
MIVVEKRMTHDRRDDFEMVESLEVYEEHPRCCQAKGSNDEENGCGFDGAFGGVGDEEVVVEEGLVEEALKEFVVELFEEYDKMSKKYGLFNLRA